MSDETTSLMEPIEPQHIWTEWSEPGVGITWKIVRVIESVTTPYQQIDLFETQTDGKLLVHDGAVMLTERFEAQYHEALVHSAMITHPNPRRVLVIGGGDGGTLREILRHPEVELARQVEIDEEVVRIAKEHLPTMASAYDDPRVDLIIGDGLKYMHDTDAGSWDVILIDSTDPVGPAVPLFEEPFFEDIKRALASDGVMASQIADITFHHDHMVTVIKRLRKIFLDARPYQAPVQMYPSGVWGFGFATRKAGMADNIDPKRAEVIEQQVRHWNRDVHHGSFAIPTWLKRELDRE